MLFFKQIVDEKFDSKSFKAFYDQECHICPGTLSLIDAMETSHIPLEKILENSGVSNQAYIDLKNGDRCDPKLVRKLYAAMALPEHLALTNCPRLK